MEKVVVVGYGEVGRAIAKLEEEAGRDVNIYDLAMGDQPGPGPYEVMHVCIPYGDNFVAAVTAGILTFEPRMTIVHSTVPVGTMYKIDASKTILIHSPIRGKHPALYDGIKTFVKYVGGRENQCGLAIRHMRKWGCVIKRIGNYEASEYFKLADTNYYAWCIAYADQVRKDCDNYGISYDKVYTDGNETYNRGYRKLKLKNVIRPVLKPPEFGLGGHCLYENALLTENQTIRNTILALGKQNESNKKTMEVVQPEQAPSN